MYSIHVSVTHVYTNTIMHLSSHVPDDLPISLHSLSHIWLLKALDEHYRTLTVTEQKCTTTATCLPLAAVPFTSHRQGCLAYLGMQGVTLSSGHDKTEGHTKESVSPLSWEVRESVVIRTQVQTWGWLRGLLINLLEVHKTTTNPMVADQLNLTKYTVTTFPVQEKQWNN